MNPQLSPLINSDFIFLSKRQWTNECWFVCVMSLLIVFKQSHTPGAFSARIIDPVSIYTIASRAFRTSIRSTLEERVGIIRNMKIMLGVCIFLQLFVFASCVSLEEFFPFGEAVGDVKLPNRNHVFGKVFNLYSTYSFYNKGFNDLRVSEFSGFYLRWSLFSALFRVVGGLGHLSFYLMLWNFFRGI